MGKYCAVKWSGAFVVVLNQKMSEGGRAYLAIDEPGTVNRDKPGGDVEDIVFPTTNDMQ